MHTTQVYIHFQLRDCAYCTGNKRKTLPPSAIRVYMCVYSKFNNFRSARSMCSQYSISNLCYIDINICSLLLLLRAAHILRIFIQIQSLSVCTQVNTILYYFHSNGTLSHIWATVSVHRSTIYIWVAVRIDGRTL